MNIHIFGASGSGTTSLGSVLAKELELMHFDTDNYYWKKTNPPYTDKNTIEVRCKLLLEDMKNQGGWVLSGSIDSWADPFLPLIDFAIFITARSDVRVKRLKEREFKEFGERIKKGGDMYKGHKDFIEWAMQYEDGFMKGRSLTRHKEWIKSVNFPVIRVSNNGTFDSTLRQVKQSVDSLKI